MSLRLDMSNRVNYDSRRASLTPASHRLDELLRHAALLAACAGVARPAAGVLEPAAFRSVERCALEVAHV
jgi:hypothetical protein